MKVLDVMIIFVTLQCVFHGIRLLRLIKIGCRETTNSCLFSILLLYERCGEHFFYDLFFAFDWLVFRKNRDNDLFANHA